jgi:hypothetical protein
VCQRTDEDDGSLFGHVEAANDLDVVEEHVEEDAKHPKHEVPQELVAPHRQAPLCLPLPLLLLLLLFCREKIRSSIKSIN